MYRIHASDRGARFYGKRDATWRWDDPSGTYGVLYLGLTRDGPFAETLLRRPSQKVVVWSEIAKRRFARFCVIEPLRLADAHGKGLGWAGVTVAEVAADHDGKTYPGAYARTQAISATVHATTDLDGVAYRSRLDPDQFCIALFDRADQKIKLIEQGEPIDRGWVDDLLDAHGKYVVDI
ncbi:RES family NAD+ phosphorylase [Sphingomonas sp. Leaf4]|uniref:RES family NAD+ phosphorylase n=1 Tax=Sphingomonas sp. Leaf4 TaxID=2876553 RepID=UPI001E42363D|nr:RES family NAD+ phosphorylase [Sphingomonas sp. Leaf4]